MKIQGTMRFSPRRTLLVILLVVLLQLTIYFWVFSPSPGTRPLTGRVRKLVPLERQSPAGQGTCNDQLCPTVKPGMINVHLIPHSHDDVGWLKTPDQYYTGEYPRTKHGEYMYIGAKQCVRCVLNTVVTELLKNPERRFIFIEMAFFSRYWNEADEKRRDELRLLIRRRQLEIILGGWVMSDAAVTYYNDIIDQHTLGFDFLQKTLGPCAQSRVAWHVDQFGHSREHAAIFSKMGFDALFVGRLDFQDHNTRKATKTLEFVWETSPNAHEHSSDLFTQVTYDGYYAPAGFVLDGVFDLFSSLQQQRGGNDDAFIRIVENRAAAFRTEHILVPMGSDFGYLNAGEWFKNMDKLIKLVNAKQEKGSKVNLLYSTPSCYVHHVHRTNLSWAVKKEDFHPYAVPPGAYWTGYFTSRAGQKLLVKRAGAVLQTCKQLGIFSQFKGAFENTDNLRRAVAVMQHHDAITGTEKTHVSDEYNRMLSEGIDKCQTVISDSYNKLLHEPGRTSPLKFSFCPNLNISQCSVTEQEREVLVLVYNPLSRPVSTYLRFPVVSNSVTVRDAKGQAVPSQLVTIAEGIQRQPERHSDSDTEVVFPALLPALGYTSFTLSIKEGGQKPTRTNLEQGDIVMENKFLKLTFDGKSGRMKELSNLKSGCSIKLAQDIAFYKGVQGGFRSSGAYVFIPEKELPQRVGQQDPIGIRMFKGRVVQEIHQHFSPWVSQVIRLYEDARHLELQWTVGPIPTADNQGKEVVSFFVSDMKTDGRFYTDSHGREVLERKLNHRETWNLTVVDAISGNYYPVVSRIYIQDKAKDIQLTLLPDRSQGGSSLYDGTLELMVHRRLLYDDGLGVGEPLDERGTDNDGVIYSGKHLLFLDTIANSAVLTREMALQVHLTPTLTFLPVHASAGAVNPRPFNSPDRSPPQKSFLGEALPPNVQILSLDYTHGKANGSTIYLLRLEHIYEKGESTILSKPATVTLKNLFASFEIKEVEEVSLGGNFSPRSHRRLKWKTDNKHTSTASIGSPDYKEMLQDPFKVTLQPMEIRTFRVLIDSPPSSTLFFS